jgi:predicted O-linked N-acetylglucosamine transferase (SPINDLY family)
MFHSIENCYHDAIVYYSGQTGLKRHPDTIRLQMKILRSVPNSFLLVKGMADEINIQQLFTQIAEQENVNINQLKFLSSDATEEIHRANLQIADVVLDTYPYNGATTTLEVLWLEIPIVTRVGQQFAARNSYTFMINAGINEGIAWTNEEYVAWGIKLGTDETLRQEIKWKLKKSKKASPLWNAQQFTLDLENAYQQMWSIFCQNNI